MSYTSLLSGLGFHFDPFAKTNADEEELLKSYFIEPPFFKAVYGDPTTPKSAVVFAPRGGGKTALKRMIEIASQPDSFVCVTYNQFPVGSKKLGDIDHDFHLQNLVKLLLVAVITSAHQVGVERLTKDDRHLIYLLAKRYFSEIDVTELKAAIASVQNVGDKAKELWDKYTGPIGLVVNALLSKIGLGEAELKQFDEQTGKLGQTIDQIQVLGAMAERLGYKCVYVLIDKVDETALTGKSSTSYRFIEPLLADLQLLESRRFGFKFFLWNLLLDEYRAVARPDRVKYYTLEWTAQQLKDMLSKRLQAHSEERVSSFGAICSNDIEGDIDTMIAHFSQGSPRNVIRLCKEIIDQQSEIDSHADKISREAVIRGFNTFAKNYTYETVQENIIRDLQKVKRADFTVRVIYTDVFRFTQQAGIQKVQSWLDAGVVEQLGTIQETKGARGSYHYGLIHLPLAKHIFFDLTIFEFFRQKVNTCSSCGQIMIRDWDNNRQYACQACQTAISVPRSS